MARDAYHTGEMQRSQKGETRTLTVPVLVGNDVAKLARQKLAEQGDAKQQKRKVARPYAWTATCDTSMARIGPTQGTAPP